MESFPASSFATLKQILDISGFKLWPIDWLRGGGGVGGGGGGDLGRGGQVSECPVTECEMSRRHIFRGEGHSFHSYL